MSAGYHELSLETDRLADRICVRVTGDLDHDSAPSLIVELDRRLEDQISAVELDLGGVTFIDSAALHVFSSVAADLRERGGSLRITQASAVVTRILEVANLGELFAS